MQDNPISRRTAIKVAGIGAAATACISVYGAATGASKTPTGDMKKITFKNDWFYNKSGGFIVERGQDAIIALMNYHGYPVYDDIRERLWVSDYGIGEFTKLGLAANMWINNYHEVPGNRYMVMDLFLMPNQMLPEHYHLQSEKALPKNEGWVVRHGISHIIGEGEETPGIRDMMPGSQLASATVFHAVKCTAGQFATLNRPLARHAQIAGPEGAILTETANYHDNDAVRHSNPKLVFP